MIEKAEASADGTQCAMITTDKLTTFRNLIFVSPPTSGDRLQYRNSGQRNSDLDHSRRIGSHDATGAVQTDDQTLGIEIHLPAVEIA
jgi:hypothetical protein